MQSKITHTALIALMVFGASPAFAQTNGYVREQVREKQATSTPALRTKAEMDARVGTTTPKIPGAAAREAMAGKLAEKIANASTTASMRLKVYASSTPEKARERVLEKRAHVESIIAAKKLVITNEMFAKIKDRTDRAAEKMTTATDRLSTASAALRTRAVELSTKGVDVSQALAILTQVDARVATLRASISDLGEDAALAAASSTPKDAWKDVQDMFKETVKELHAIRDLLHDAVAALKDAVRTAGLGRGVSGAVSEDGNRNRNESTATTTTAVATSTATTTAQ